MASACLGFDTRPMLTPFFEARAWRIATQIVRRAPKMLTLLESTFEGDFYILHSVVPRSAAGPLEAYRQRLVDVNRHGTIVGRADRQLPSELETAMRAPTLLFDRAPRLYQELTASLGMVDPRPLPASTPEIMSFRFVVAWLQLHSTLGCSYACWQGVDDEGHVRANYFGAFQEPLLAGLAMERRIDQTRWCPEYGFWFISETDKPPVACVDSHGILHTPDGATFDIRLIYRESGRNIWGPVSAVRSHLEGKGLVSPP